jgi:hypothetical protein
MEGGGGGRRRDHKNVTVHAFAQAESGEILNIILVLNVCAAP